MPVDDPSRKASDLLIDQADIEGAFGPGATAELAESATQASSVGEVLRSAAVDSAYRQFLGQRPAAAGPARFTVGDMVLVFGSAAVAGRTFEQVAKAAHLRTRVDGSEVTVETVKAGSGLVSYWGYVHRGDVIEIITIDTLEPQKVSIADLRMLVEKVTRRLQRAGGQ